jgi:hypothetical protein
MPESKGAYLRAVNYINTQLATEAHGITRKDKCITKRFSVPESNGAYLSAFKYINTQLATEAHGITWKDKCSTRRFSVSFRVLPWQRV